MNPSPRTPEFFKNSAPFSFQENVFTDREPLI